LEGWQNLDLPNVDIRKPLEWPDDSMEGIFLEHVIEHVPPPDAFRFMREAFRVLKPGGVLRLAFPDTVRIYREATPDYLQFLLNSGYGDGSVESAVTSIILNHGHCGIWSEEVMCVVLATAGFDEITVCVPGDSEHAAMRGLEQHGKRIGERNNLVETCCVDAVKRKSPHTPVKSAGAW
jgi:SAM-dependent methyltransferase